ncbi:hypothetical protein AMTR_s00058p00216430 [Amborella trichopoda]|uniref:Uncharacterized protein n=1 Tax=Amborella trichopoda TaxID=13333 RepID=W1PHZ3_AMBTC|nr:hypothetical protein AMTR_s00058p00216430 [Amborella trichopoda]
MSSIFNGAPATRHRLQSQNRRNRSTTSENRKARTCETCNFLRWNPADEERGRRERKARASKPGSSERRERVKHEKANPVSEERTDNLREKGALEL